MTRSTTRTRRAEAETLGRSLLVSATMIYWTTSVSGWAGVGGVAFLLLLPLLLVAAGRVAVALMRMTPRAAFRRPLEMLLGFTAVTPAVFALDAFTPLPSVLCWIAVGVAVAAAGSTLWLRRRGTEVGPSADTRAAAASPARGALVLVLAPLGATLWTQGLPPYRVDSPQGVVFRPWSDPFVHAQVTGQLAAAAPMRRLGNPGLFGEPLPVYHYGSYVNAAGAEAWSGATAFDAVVSLWIPLGLLPMGLSAYALGAECWGDAGGLPALCAALLLPDGSPDGVPVEWFSYHWLLAVAPAGPYGIAGGAAALVLVTSARPAATWAACSTAGGEG